MSLRLLVRPRPHEHEHLTSYLMRVGAANGFEAPVDSASFLSKMKRMLRTPSGVTTFAKYTGIDEKDLLGLMTRHEAVPGAPNPLNQFSREAYFRLGRTAYCPACIQQLGTIKAIWHFRAVAVCDVHGNWLVERCPACSALIGWDRPEVALCKCGFNLGEAETIPAPTDVAILTKMLVARLRSEPASHLLALSEFCKDLEHIAPVEWLAAFNFFASGFVQSGRFHPVQRTDGLQQEKSGASIAVQFFQNWPRQAARAVSRSWRHATWDYNDYCLVSKRVLIDGLPPIRHGLRLAGKGALALPKFMSEMLEAYVADLSLGVDDNEPALNPAMVTFPNQGPVTVTVANGYQASQLGIRWGAEKPVVTLSELMCELRQMKTGHQTLEDMGQAIGATAHQRQELVRVGLLRIIRGGVILSREVHRFRQWVSDLASVWSASGSRAELRPLSSFSPTCGSLFRRVMLAVASGELRIYHLHDKVDPDLQSLFVERESVAAFRKRTR